MIGTNTIFQIGCCVEYVGSDISTSVAQCNVQNCTTIEVNDSGAEALECYRSRLRDNSMLDKCHGKLLLVTLSLVISIHYSIVILFNDIVLN